MNRHWLQAMPRKMMGKDYHARRKALEMKR
jgi:hypothetical protein